MTAYDPRLLDALEASTVATVRGVVWRQILEPTSVLRSNQRGARWNPPGTEALYCSLDPETAAAEIDHLISSQPVPITRQRSTYGIDVVVSRVVDIRSPGWSEGFGFSYDVTDVEVCQTIGGAVAVLRNVCVRASSSSSSCASGRWLKLEYWCVWRAG